MNAFSTISAVLLAIAFLGAGGANAQPDSDAHMDDYLLPAHRGYKSGNAGLTDTIPVFSCPPLPQSKGCDQIARLPKEWKGHTSNPSPQDGSEMNAINDMDYSKSDWTIASTIYGVEWVRIDFRFPQKKGFQWADQAWIPRMSEEKKTVYMTDDMSGGEAWRRFEVTTGQLTMREKPGMNTYGGKKTGQLKLHDIGYVCADLPAVRHGLTYWLVCAEDKRGKHTIGWIADQVRKGSLYTTIKMRPQLKHTNPLYYKIETFSALKNAGVEYPAGDVALN